MPEPGRDVVKTQDRAQSSGALGDPGSILGGIGSITGFGLTDPIVLALVGWAHLAHAGIIISPRLGNRSYGAMMAAPVTLAYGSTGSAAAFEGPSRAGGVPGRGLDTPGTRREDRPGLALSPRRSHTPARCPSRPAG